GGLRQPARCRPRAPEARRRSRRRRPAGSDRMDVRLHERTRGNPADAERGKGEEMSDRLKLLVCAVAIAGSAPAAQSAPRKIIVGSPTLKAGETMPRDYTPDGRNVSPPLTWTDVPPGTKEIAVVCEDPDAGNPP